MRVIVLNWMMASMIWGIWGMYRIWRATKTGELGITSLRLTNFALWVPPILYGQAFLLMILSHQGARRAHGYLGTFRFVGCRVCGRYRSKAG
jgi:hypothetical protein